MRLRNVIYELTVPLTDELVAELWAALAGPRRLTPTPWQPYRPRT